MPIHEYKCRQCGHEFEELVRRSGQRIVCGKCQSSAVDRRLSTFSAVVSKSGGCDVGDNCPQNSCCGGKCSHQH